MDLYLELQSLLHALQRDQVDYALCGGFALAVYGIVRATEDIDLMVLESSLPHIRQTVESLGFRLASSALLFHEDQVQIHRLVKTWQNSEDSVVLDLLLVSPLIKPAWDTRTIVSTDLGRFSQWLNPSKVFARKRPGSGRYPSLKGTDR